MKKKDLQKNKIAVFDLSSMRPLFLFLGAFALISGLVLGLFWYGKQPAHTFRFKLNLPHVTLPKVARSSVIEYYDPLAIVDDLKNSNNNVLFLDIRSKEEYAHEHIKHAYSAPTYLLQGDTIKYINLQEIINDKQIDRSKLIVVYGPSTSFQKQRELVDLLKGNGYNAQQLAIGWNELRHFQNSWIPEGLWGKMDVNSIIEKNDIN